MGLRPADGAVELASLKAERRAIDRVSGWLKVLGFVSAAPGFSGTPLVTNGFSDLILKPE